MSAALAKLHIAAKEVGLEDGDYRDLLERITGQRTAKGLSEAQIGLVLDELKAKGWTPRSKAARPGDRPARPSDHPVAKKARALWISLYHLGEIRDPSERALEAFAKRQLKCERLQWADQGQGAKLIEALKAMAERAGWSQDTGFAGGGMAVYLLKRQLLGAQAKRLGLGHAMEGIGETATQEEMEAEIARRGQLIRDLQGATQ